MTWTYHVYRGWRSVYTGMHIESWLAIVYAIEGFPDEPVSELMVPGTWHSQPKEGQHGEEAEAT